MTLLNEADAIYLGGVAVDAIYAGSTKVWGEEAASGPSESILVSYTPGTDRNDFTGEVGVRLGIGGAPFTVNWLGARCNGYGGTRTVKIYEWFSDSAVALAVIDYTGKAAGEYAWTAIPPLTLAANGYYAMLMAVTAGDGMWWKNPGATSFIGMANIYDCYRVPGGGLSTGGAGAQFIGLDLGW